MVLTDDELRGAYWSGLGSGLDQTWGLRAVESAVLDRLIAECDRMHTGVTTYKQRLMGEMAGDWLRSKVKA